MAINISNYQRLLKEAQESGATLVAVSKTKPIQDIQALYELGQRDFGENYVQELTEKAARLPTDIRWHFIGHLQRNKVKYIAGFVHLIQGVDSFRLLEEISRQADKLGRSISCLLQIHIAREETKFGMDEVELQECFKRIKEEREAGRFQHIQVCGLMGMASFSDDRDLVKREMATLKQLQIRYNSEFDLVEGKTLLSMGMSADYDLALSEGSNLIRVGSSLFGAREYRAQP